MRGMDVGMQQSCKPTGMQLEASCLVLSLVARESRHMHPKLIVSIMMSIMLMMSG